MTLRNVRFGALLCACAVTAAFTATPAAAVSGPGPEEQRQPRVIVLHGATLIDGTGAPPRGPVTIVIRDGRIAQVAGPPAGAGRGAAGHPPAGVTVPPGATVFDVSGRWVMPGLVDVHAHMPSDAALQQEVLRTYLAFGITTARSTAALPQAAGVLLRDRLAAGELAGPRFVTAGWLIDAPGSAWANARMVATEDETRAEVRSQAALGVDLIKVYSQMPPHLVAAAIDEAHLLGLPVTGHLGRTRWHEAAAMGIDHLAHSAYWGMFVSLVPDVFYDQFEVYRNFYLPAAAGTGAPLLLANHWRSVFDPAGPELARLIEAMKTNGVTWDPNLVFSEAVMFGDDPSNLARYEPAFAPQSWQTAWAAQLHPYSFFWAVQTFAAAQATWPVVLDITRRMHEGGVILTAGSDHLNPWMTPGVALHRELLLLNEAGIPAHDVLQIATRNGARAARVLGETGTIAVGKSADLLVLTRDPLADIRNTRAIERVFLRGQPYRPQELLAGGQ